MKPEASGTKPESLKWSERRLLKISLSLLLSLSLPLSLSPSPLLIPLFTILTSSYSSSFPLLGYTLQDVSRTAHCAEISSRRELVGLACCKGQCVRDLTKKHDNSVIIFSPSCHFKPIRPFFLWSTKGEFGRFLKFSVCVPQEGKSSKCVWNSIWVSK